MGKDSKRLGEHRAAWGSALKDLGSINSKKNFRVLGQHGKALTLSIKATHKNLHVLNLL